MGRNSKPPELRAAQGNPGKRALPPTASEAAPAEASETSGAVPVQLVDDAKALWSVVAVYLSSMSYMRAVDREVVARYCEHVSRWWKLTAKINESGETYWTDSKHGRMERINPSLIARDRLESRIEALEDRIGLNPRARQQILAQLAGHSLNHPGDLFGGGPADQPIAAAGNESQPAPKPAAELRSPIGLLN